LKRSRKSLSQQKTLSLFDEADFSERRVKPDGTKSGLRDIPAQSKEAIREATVSALMEQVISHGNLQAALRRVEQNKGAAGVDKMTVNPLRPHLMKHWPSLKQSLLTAPISLVRSSGWRFQNPLAACDY
jgi:RNA-directed DNA polymerase